MKYLIAFFSSLFLIVVVNAQVLDHSWKEFIKSKDEAWFSTQEAKDVAENVLLYQRNIGGWPKNIQMQKPLSSKEKKKLKKEKKNPKGATTDNNATIMEMGFLSKMYKNVPDDRYKKSFLLGLNYLLDAQYDNGGWPQFFPTDSSKYSSQITYNDNSMVNIMELLNHVIDSNYYSIKPDVKTLDRAKVAFDKGIVCILKTQYKQNGVLTAWCAQHDKYTLLPTKARAYELPSLSGKESAGIVLLLMSLDNPSQEVIDAVNQAVVWFEKTKIKGWRQESYVAEGGLKEKRLVADSTAPALWARFMELENNTPFFCDRDGIKKATMFEIGQERRAGYAWYGEDPQKVLKKYPAWKKKWNIK